MIKADAMEAIQVRGKKICGQEQVTSAAALEFVAYLQREFNPGRLRLLARRTERQAGLDAGDAYEFPAKTVEVAA